MAEQLTVLLPGGAASPRCAGVLEAALDLRLDLEPETPEGELMETLSQRYMTD